MNVSSVTRHVQLTLAWTAPLSWSVKILPVTFDSNPSEQAALEAFSLVETLRPSVFLMQLHVEEGRGSMHASRLLQWLVTS